MKSQLLGDVGLETYSNFLVILQLYTDIPPNTHISVFLMKSRRSSRKSDGNSQNGIVGAIIYDKNAALISENSISSENIDNHVSLDEDTDIYIANCKKYMINPDPGVLISLKTR